MPMPKYIVILLILFLLICCSREELNQLTAAEKAEGWILLFDGHSFSGWRGLGQAGFPEEHWTIENGAIKKIPSSEVPRQADGQPIQGGDILTINTFQDFEMVWEWKISPAGNSGIKYNVSEEMSTAYPPDHAALGFEYQILDDEKHPDGLKTPMFQAGSLYNLVGPMNKRLKPVGEYNSARIVFHGNHGEHWLNGKKILEFNLDTPEFKALLAKSKYHKYPNFAQKRKGHIVLQDHTDAVWYRNIKIRELQPERMADHDG